MQSLTSQASAVKKIRLVPTKICMVHNFTWPYHAPFRDSLPFTD